MSPEKEQLRKEHNQRVHEGIYKKLLGCECVNCGSRENIEYHHIVPICVGGANKISNIAPVCNSCHIAIHSEKEYRKEAVNNCQKTKKKEDESLNKAIQQYIECKMPQEELRNILGIRGALSSNKYYKNYLHSRGIKMVVNKVGELIDDWNYPPSKDTELGHIVYTNGTVKSIFYEG